ncbi:MAG: hypothetical protein ACK5JH_15170 [Anaerocolumna sp.]
MEKIKIKGVSYEIQNIAQYRNLLILEFTTEADISELDLSLIELYTNGGLKCSTFTGYTTAYKSDGTTIILSNDETVYTEPEPYVPVPPTVEELAYTEVIRLKSKISETDYQIIKCYEYQLVGKELPYDISKLHATRQTLRDGINTLEVSLDSE